MLPRCSCNRCIVHKRTWDGPAAGLGLACAEAPAGESLSPSELAPRSSELADASSCSSSCCWSAFPLLPCPVQQPGAWAGKQGWAPPELRGTCRKPPTAAGAACLSCLVSSRCCLVCRLVRLAAQQLDSRTKQGQTCVGVQQAILLCRLVDGKVGVLEQATEARILHQAGRGGAVRRDLLPLGVLCQGALRQARVHLLQAGSEAGARGGLQLPRGHQRTGCSLLWPPATPAGLHGRRQEPP